MKRLLFIIAVLTSLNAAAQQTDSLNINRSDISADSLLVRLEGLERENDYLLCEYELTKVVLGLKDLDNSISIKSNSLLIRCFNTKYDSDQYYWYSRLYDSYVENFNTSKTHAESVKAIVAIRILNSNFTEQELKALSANIALIDSTISTVESAIEYFDIVLKAYRSLR